MRKWSDGEREYLTAMGCDEAAIAHAVAYLDAQQMLWESVNVDWNRWYRRLWRWLRRAK